MILVLLYQSTTKLISVEPIPEDGAPGVAAIEGAALYWSAKPMVRMAYARIFMGLVCMT